MKHQLFLRRMTTTSRSLTLQQQPRKQQQLSSSMYISSNSTAVPCLSTNGSFFYSDGNQKRQPQPNLSVAVAAGTKLSEQNNPRHRQQNMNVRFFSTRNETNNKKDVTKIPTTDHRDHHVVVDDGMGEEKEKEDELLLHQQQEEKEEEEIVLERTMYVHPLSQIILEYFQSHKHDWILLHGLEDSLTIHRDGSFELKFKHYDTKTDGTTSSTTTRTTSASATASNSSTSSPIKKTPQTNGRIWTSYDEDEKKHWLTVHLLLQPIMTPKQSMTQRPSKDVTASSKRNKDTRRNKRGEDLVVELPTLPSEQQNKFVQREKSQQGQGGREQGYETETEDDDADEEIVYQSEVYKRFLLQDNLLPAWHANRKSLPERIQVAVDQMIKVIDEHSIFWLAPSSSSSTSYPSSRRPSFKEQRQQRQRRRQQQQQQQQPQQQQQQFQQRQWRSRKDQ